MRQYNLSIKVHPAETSRTISVSRIKRALGEEEAIKLIEHLNKVAPQSSFRKKNLPPLKVSEYEMLKKIITTNPTWKQMEKMLDGKAGTAAHKLRALMHRLLKHHYDFNNIPNNLIKDETTKCNI